MGAGLTGEQIVMSLTGVYETLGRVGCPHYISPEVVSRRIYGKACDVWGAGVMLHVLLSGRLPFQGSGKRLQEAIARGRVMESFLQERCVVLARMRTDYKLEDEVSDGFVRGLEAPVEPITFS
ncbi:hypothetical protein pipiens_019464 [Culex pipiens pipiens]|uniref:Protein kinase domain-containing protein n=1 Tax=Culex pipiens pipiens TaxID=38569 RepID=A0ABD1DTY6_CULPP